MDNTPSFSIHKLNRKLLKIFKINYMLLIFLYCYVKGFPLFKDYFIVDKNTIVAKIFQQ